MMKHLATWISNLRLAQEEAVETVPQQAAPVAEPPVLKPLPPPPVRTPQQIVDQYVKSLRPEQLREAFLQFPPGIVAAHAEKLYVWTMLDTLVSWYPEKFGDMNACTHLLLLDKEAAAEWIGQNAQRAITAHVPLGVVTNPQVAEQVARTLSTMDLGFYDVHALLRNTYIDDTAKNTMLNGALELVKTRLQNGQWGANELNGFLGSARIYNIDFGPNLLAFALSQQELAPYAAQYIKSWSSANTDWKTKTFKTKSTPAELAILQSLKNPNILTSVQTSLSSLDFRQDSLEDMLKRMGIEAPDQVLFNVYTAWMKNTMLGNVNDALFSTLNRSRVARSAYKRWVETEIPEDLNLLASRYLILAGHGAQYAEANKWFHQGWTSSSKSPQSNSYAMIVRNLFGGENVLNPMQDSKISPELLAAIPAKSTDALTSHVQNTYGITQQTIRQSVEQDKKATLNPEGTHIRLFRGVETAYAVPHVLESWTSSMWKSTEFDGCYVLSAWVPLEAILSSYTSRHWEGDFGPDKANTEFEYIVIRNKLPNSEIRIEQVGPDCDQKDKSKTLSDVVKP